MTMEDTEMISLWKAYDRKLEASLSLNRKIAEDITKIKVKSLLASMQPLKIFAVLAGVLWVLFGGSLIASLLVSASGHVSPFFLVSAAIQLSVTAVAVAIYAYQLVLIQQVDISQPVMATQGRLANLQSSTLWSARVMFLQLPVWTTFYWNEGMMENGVTALHLLQVAVTILFTWAAMWLFVNIKYANKDKEWFRMIFNGKEWEPLLKSMEFCVQIEKFGREDSISSTAASKARNKG